MRTAPDRCPWSGADLVSLAAEDVRFELTVTSLRQGRSRTEAAGPSRNDDPGPTYGGRERPSRASAAPALRTRPATSADPPARGHRTSRQRSGHAPHPASGTTCDPSRGATTRPPARTRLTPPARAHPRPSPWTFHQRGPEEARDHATESRVPGEPGMAQAPHLRTLLLIRCRRRLAARSALRRIDRAASRCVRGQRPIRVPIDRPAHHHRSPRPPRSTARPSAALSRRARPEVKTSTTTRPPEANRSERTAFTSRH